MRREGEKKQKTGGNRSAKWRLKLFIVDSFWRGEVVVRGKSV